MSTDYQHLGIRVNTIAPDIDSPMLHSFITTQICTRLYPPLAFNEGWPAQCRLVVGTIDEVANVFLFLASDESTGPGQAVG